MATEIKRLFDIPQYQLENYNLDKAFVSKSSGDGWPLLQKNSLKKQTK